MDGVLVIDKPPGLTSHDVVVRARRALSTRRIGHIGTLDPMATGILPLVVGRATRLASYLSLGPKVYEATIRLGVVTDTYDVTGTVVSRPSDDTERAAGAVNLTTVSAACQAFTGTLQQRPPPFSAKRVRGVRAYRIARRQQPVDLKPVEVTVHRLEILTLDSMQLRCRVSCSTGFYMRALAHDIGQRLGCGGCLESLRREQSGTFTQEHAVSLDDLERGGPESRGRFIPTADLLPKLPGVVASRRGSERVSHGNPLMPSEFTPAVGSPPLQGEPTARHDVKVYDNQGTLLAIAETGPGNVLHPRIVLV